MVSKGGIHRMERMRGQAILEYVIMLTFIIIVFVVVGRRFFRPRVEQMVYNEGNVISQSSDNMVKYLGGL